MVNAVLDQMREISDELLPAGKGLEYDLSQGTQQAINIAKPCAIFLG